MNNKTKGAAVDNVDTVKEIILDALKMKGGQPLLLNQVYKDIFSICGDRSIEVTLEVVGVLQAEGILTGGPIANNLLWQTIIYPRRG